MSRFRVVPWDAGASKGPCGSLLRHCKQNAEAGQEGNPLSILRTRNPSKVTPIRADQGYEPSPISFLKEQPSLLRPGTH